MLQLTSLIKSKRHKKTSHTQALTQINTKGSIGNRLFLYIFLSVFMCVLFVGISSYLISGNLLEEKVTEASKQTIQQVGSNLDIVFSNTDRIINDFYSKDFRGILEDYDRESIQTDEYRLLKAAREIQERIYDVTRANDHINVHVFSQAHGTVFSSVNEVNKDNALKESLVSNKWYKYIAEEKRVLWIGGNNNGLTGTLNTPTISVGRFLSIGKGGYVIVIEIKEDLITNILQGVSFGENDEIKIVDSNDMIQFSFLKDEIGRKNDYTFEKKADEGSYVHSDGSDLGFIYHSVDTGFYLYGRVSIAKLTKDTQIIALLTLFMVVVCSIISMIVGRRVVKMIGFPLRELALLMGRASEGDLTVRSHILRRQDEIGQLGDSFNEMLDKISVLIENTTITTSKLFEEAIEISRVASITDTTANEVAGATGEIAKGAQELAEQSVIGSGLTLQMNDGVEKLSSNNQEMNDLVVEVGKASDDGMKKMNSLIVKTKHSEEMINEILGKISGLKENTSKINELMEILYSISKQTNLLSLNAGIEAARAGEAGKGFAVVAQEIRKLSNDSKTAVDIVGKTTSTIVKAVDETVDVLQKALPVFKEQSVTAGETDQILNQVERRMIVVNKKLNDVWECILQLQKFQEFQSQAVSKVRCTSEQSAAISEELYATTEGQLSISKELLNTSVGLKELSETLQNILSKFITK